MGLLIGSITAVFRDWSKPLVVGVMSGIGAVSLLVLIVEGELSGRRWPQVECDRPEAIRRDPRP